MKAPSALPGISPTGGEIGWAAPLGSIVIVWGDAPYGSISSLGGDVWQDKGVRHTLERQRLAPATRHNTPHQPITATPALAIRRRSA
ncbi:hypothetical protein [Rhizobium sp. 18055]|uniref:hypothetical protein n=1 Tax=Rhizobium sp. 18055 TaxID=2681403 RepID=UPI00190FA02E|nr:hypothetical protein [Rhizobium sp. 18055]